MRRFVLIRLTEMVLTLLVLSVVVFYAVHETGDPLRIILGDNYEVTPEVYQQARERLGLDQPLVVQYLIFIRSVVTSLDFGVSLTQSRPVRDLVLERLPYTLQLAGAGMLLALLLGIPAGIVAALRRGSKVDRALRVFAMVSISVPGFWLASMMILVFAAILGWLPAFGAGGLDHLILPAFAVALPVSGGLMRITRSSMLDVLDRDYIKFARIKGLRERLVIWRHALRNAAIPVLTFIGLGLAGLLNGSVVVEVVFGWPGLGQLAVQAVLFRDVPLVVATTLISGFLFIATAFVVDILYGFADPRIQYR